MADEFVKLGHKLVTGGTDNHLILIDCKNVGLTGSKVEKICDHLHITINKNTIVGDKSAMNPSGARVGTHAITTRGYMEEDSRQVARFMH